MIKKLTFILAILIVISLVACSNDTSDTNSDNSDNEENNENTPDDNFQPSTYLSDEIVEVDINGDGQKESIQLVIGEEEAILNINDASITVGTPWFLRSNEFKLVDLDKEDNFLEIAIEDVGPSDDPTTGFYVYDGSDIKQVGWVEGFMDKEGVIAKVTINGDGTLTAPMRLSILQTWFTKVSYKLDDNHTLEMQPQRWYEVDFTVKTIEEISLYTEPNINSDIVNIEAGKELKFTSTDNMKWIEVKTEDEKICWLFVDNPFDYYSKLEGLALYD